MVEKVDERHVGALLGTAGKAIASMPGAKNLVARMREADSPERLARMLQGLDLGVDEPARATIQDAVLDERGWREAHALLVRSAEQQLIERFSPGA